MGNLFAQSLGAMLGSELVSQPRIMQLQQLLEIMTALRDIAKAKKEDAIYCLKMKH